MSDHMPRFEPPVNEIRVATDGSVWLEREALQTDPVLWWVLDDRGDLVARLRLPARLKIRHIDHDAVWGIAYDDLDVNYVVEFSIRR